LVSGAELVLLGIDTVEITQKSTSFDRGLSIFTYYFFAIDPLK
jgi:hypothetical protein